MSPMDTDEDDDDDRKPAAAAPAATTEDTTLKTTKTRYWAIRKCDTLKGPAIFTDWEDCSFYIEENGGNNDDNDDEEEQLEYAVWDTAVEALDYIISGGGVLDDSDTLLLLPRTGTSSQSSPRQSRSGRNSKKRTVNDASSPNTRSGVRKRQRTSVEDPASTAGGAEGLDMQTKSDLKWEEKFQLLKDYKEENDGSFKGVYNLQKNQQNKGKYSILTNFYKAESRRVQRIKELEQSGDLTQISEKDKIKIQRLREIGFTSAEGVASQPNPTGVMMQKRATTTSRRTAAGSPPPAMRAATRAATRKQTSTSPTTENDGQSKRDQAWEEKFEKLIEYKQQHGSFYGIYNLRTTKDEKKKEFSMLTNFIHSERRRVQKVQQLEKEDPTSISEKDKEKVQRLREIGFGTEESGTKTDANAPDSRSLSFDEMFEQLKNFRAQHGHLTIPLNEENKQLKNWIIYQRNSYKRMKRGKQTDMTHERLARLVELGLKMEVEERKPFEVRATEWFEYKTKHGKDPTSDSAVGCWARHQREKYAKKQQGISTNLTDKQIEQLDAFGFRWKISDLKKKVTAPKSWEERYEELVEYKRKYGNCNVPQKPSTLGGWVHRQRGDYRQLKRGLNSGLNAEKIQKLKSIGFQFNMRKRRSKQTGGPHNLVELIEEDDDDNDGGGGGDVDVDGNEEIPGPSTAVAVAAAAAAPVDQILDAYNINMNNFYTRKHMSAERHQQIPAERQPQQQQQQQQQQHVPMGRQLPSGRRMPTTNL